VSSDEDVTIEGTSIPKINLAPDGGLQEQESKNTTTLKFNENSGGGGLLEDSSELLGDLSEFKRMTSDDLLAFAGNSVVQGEIEMLQSILEDSPIDGGGLSFDDTARVIREMKADLGTADIQSDGNKVVGSRIKWNDNIGKPLVYKPPGWEHDGREVTIDLGFFDSHREKGFKEACMVTSDDKHYMAKSPLTNYKWFARADNPNFLRMGYALDGVIKSGVDRGLTRRSEFKGILEEHFPYAIKTSVSANNSKTKLSAMVDGVAVRFAPPKKSAGKR
jgi:hypothetical protein